MQLPTLEELLEWACAKNPHKPIGKVARLCECPLANYLNEHDETGVWQVEKSRVITPDRGHIESPVPFQHIVFLVDSCPGCEDGNIYPPQFIHIVQTVQAHMEGVS